MPGGIILFVVFIKDKGGGVIETKIGAFSESVKVDAGCDPSYVIRYFIVWRKVNIIIIVLTHGNPRGEFVVKLRESGRGK